MVLVFVWTDIKQGTPHKMVKGSINLSIAALAGILRKQLNIKVDVLHLLNEDLHEIDSYFSSQQVDIVAYSVMENTMEVANRISTYIKKKFNVYSIMGGVYPTQYPKEAISFPGIDAICIGEGDEAIVELCRNFDNLKKRVSVRNFWFKEKSGKIYKNETKPGVSDLDTLPPMALDLFDEKKIGTLNSRLASLPVIFSRGCPFNCAFCMNSALKKSFKMTGKIRRYSPEKTIEYLKHYLSCCNSAKSIAFEDDVLADTMKGLKDFSKLYLEEINIPYRCSARLEQLSKEEFCSYLEKNCLSVSVGIECGNEVHRQKMLNKKFSNHLIERALTNCRKYHIRVKPNIIIGLPFEEINDMLDSVKFIASMDFTAPPMFSIFRPYKFTELYDYCERLNLLNTNLNYYDDNTGSILKKSTKWHETLLSINRNYHAMVSLYYYLFRRSWGKEKIDSFVKNLDSFFLTASRKEIDILLAPLNNIDIQSQMYRSSEKNFLHPDEVRLKEEDIFDYDSYIYDNDIFDSCIFNSVTTLQT